LWFEIKNGKEQVPRPPHKFGLVGEIQFMHDDTWTFFAADN